MRREMKGERKRTLPFNLPYNTTQDKGTQDTY